MTNRVLFGQRNGVFGLWVSKPGYDVLTADWNDMMFSTDQRSGQIVQTGAIPVPSIGSLPVAVTIPNLGYYPMVKWYLGGWVGEAELRYDSMSQIRFTFNQVFPPQNPGPVEMRLLKYQVMALNLNG